MTNTIRLLLTGVAMLSSLGCSPSSPPQLPVPEPLTVPAGPESTGPRLSAAGPDGTLILSWMQPDAIGTSLYFSRFRDGSWDTRKNVISGAKVFVNWADLPSVVALDNRRLAAHWLGQKPDNVYSYDVQFMRSMDGGATWSVPITPHSDNTPTEHGFVSIFAEKNRAGLVWLDGRKMVNEVTDDPVESGMTLRAAFIDEHLALIGEQMVDELICDCCQTDIAITASGPIAVYRDRSVDEIRDIAVTRYVNGSWQNGRTVAADNWEIAGCPVNGPSIAAQDRSVAVAWFTAAQSRPVVKVAFSSNNGQSFLQPQIVASENTVGRVGVAMLDDRHAAVSWMQSGENGAAVVLVRKASPGGGLGTTIIVSELATQFSVPQMARIDDYLVFAWSEKHEGVDRIASARLSVNALND